MPQSFRAIELSTASGPVAKDDRVVRRRLVKLGTRGIPLLPQPGDENLLQVDPFAGPHRRRPLPEEAQHVGDRFHGGNLMVEFVHRGRHDMQVGVDQPGQHGFSAQIDLLRLWPGQLEHLGALANGHNAIAADGHRLDDAEIGINGHNFAMMHDQVGRRRLSAAAEAVATNPSRANTVRWRRYMTLLPNLCFTLARRPDSLRAGTSPQFSQTLRGIPVS